MENEIYDLVIVGGGISGLYFLYKILKLKPDWKILLLEKEDRLGGRIWTVYDDEGNPLYERGARRIMHNHYRMINLIKELGLELIELNNINYTDDIEENINNASIDKNYYYIKTGYSSVINSLIRLIPKYHILKLAMVTNIIYNKNYYDIEAKLFNKNNFKYIQSKYIILACPPQFFTNWNIYSNIKHIVDLVYNIPVLKVNVLTKNIVTYEKSSDFKIVFNNPPQIIHSSMYNNNWFVPLYITGKVANEWENLSKTDIKLWNKKFTLNINRFFKNIDILEYEIDYWEFGYTNWKSEKSLEVYKKALIPLDNLIIIGEAFSSIKFLGDSWSEGAIETSEYAINLFLNYKVNCCHINDICLMYNQLDTLSCTANALSLIISFIQKKNCFYVFPMSRLYIYYNTRLLMNTLELDKGSDVLSAINSIIEFGICPEVLWPFKLNNLYLKPPNICYEYAKNNRFFLDYKIIKLSECDWRKLITQYLLNNILILCSIDLYYNTVINNGDILNSIENNSNLIVHDVVLIGINYDLELLSFINSQGDNDFIFYLTFNQLDNINPIHNTLYAIDGYFQNNFTIDIYKLQAIYQYENMINYTIKHLKSNTNVNINRIFDHVIIGCGITGRYLAYQLDKIYPNDSILILTNDNLEHGLSNQTVYFDITNEFILPTTSIMYRCNSLTSNLIKQLNINSAQKKVKFNHEEMYDNLIKKCKKILNINSSGDDLNIEMFKNNFFCKTNLYAFLISEGFNTDSIEKLFSNFKIPLNKDITALYYLLSNINDCNYVYFDCLKELLGKLIEKFEIFKLGDFIHNLSNNRIIVSNVEVSEIFENKLIIDCLSIDFTNVYSCNMTTELCNSLIPTIIEDANIYLFTKSDIEEFDTIHNLKWGLIIYINSNTILCKNLNINFFNEIKISCKIKLKNYYEYKIENFEMVGKLLKNFPFKDIEFYSFKIFNWPFYLKCQKLIEVDEKFFNFYERLLYQFNINGNYHILNNGYSIFPSLTDGSIYMVNEFLKQKINYEAN